MDQNKAAERSRSSVTLLCLASYEKGHRFLQQAQQEGCTVYLLTSESLRATAAFPLESLADIFYMPDQALEWNSSAMVEAVAHLARRIKFDAIVALDDFDVEKAALLREHFRLPGLGETATRKFRDKLAMRTSAAAAGLPVPPFTATFNYLDLTHFVDAVPPPWVLKPRMLAGAIGIKKFTEREAFWQQLHQLENQQSFYVLEQFVPGDIFHVDSIWFGGRMVTAIASAYGTPPLEVTHDGGIFTTRLLPRDHALAAELCNLNRRVLEAFAFQNGVSHTEFIRAHADGKLYFLETSARVGGAYIADLVEAGTGMNLWAEWAKIEAAVVRGDSYAPPVLRQDSAGLLVSLARDEWPDTSAFRDPEIVLRITRKHHVGFVVRSPDHNRISQLLTEYTDQVRKEHHASAPALNTPHQ